jgi:hypothetical protein
MVDYEIKANVEGGDLEALNPVADKRIVEGLFKIN